MELALVAAAQRAAAAQAAALAGRSRSRGHTLIRSRSRRCRRTDRRCWPRPSPAISPTRRSSPCKGSPPRATARLAARRTTTARPPLSPPKGWRFGRRCVPRLPRPAASTPQSVLRRSRPTGRRPRCRRRLRGCRTRRRSTAGGRRFTRPLLVARKHRRPPPLAHIVERRAAAARAAARAASKERKLGAAGAPVVCGATPDGVPLTTPIHRRPPPLPTGGAVRAALHSRQHAAPGSPHVPKPGASARASRAARLAAAVPGGSASSGAASASASGAVHARPGSGATRLSGAHAGVLGPRDFGTLGGAEGLRWALPPNLTPDPDPNHLQP